MANLKTLLERKLDQIDYDETNLAKGTIQSFSVSSNSHYGGATSGGTISCIFCWLAPANGRAVIDVWGAGGSTPLSRCCGASLPGNPGAWSRKCICIDAGQMICGKIGFSCNNATAACFRGCSEPTEVCWAGKNRTGGTTVTGCICAQGGRGGTFICMTGGGIMYCCFTNANAFCGTLSGSSAGCGVVCNYGVATGAAGCAEAYGGDINKRGGFSCMTFGFCWAACICAITGHVAVAPGIYACDGMVVSHGYENDNGFAQWSGTGLFQYIASLNAGSPQPSRGIPFATCYNGAKACACSERMGCGVYVPHGSGAPGTNPCGDFCHHGWRGGNGLVRINFIPKD